MGPSKEQAEASSSEMEAVVASLLHSQQRRTGWGPPGYPSGQGGARPHPLSVPSTCCEHSIGCLSSQVLGSCCSPGNAPFYAGPELVCCIGYTRVGFLPRKRHRTPWGLGVGKVPWRHSWLPYLHLKGSLSRCLCWVLASEETYQHGAFLFPNPDPGLQLEAKLVVPQD